MAKIMNYTSADGVVHPVSYWIPSVFVRAKTLKRGEITFHGYHTKEARDQLFEPVGSKRYIFNPNQYDVYFSDAILDQNGIDPSRQAYSLAENTFDTNGKSFFDQATDD